MWESQMLDVRMGLSRILRRGCLGSVECLRVGERGFWEVGMDEMEQAHGLCRSGPAANHTTYFE